jgi:diguanylate cyclase (GGDEF)-like protein
MDSNDFVFAYEQRTLIQDDLRQQISSLLLDRIDAVTADAVAIFPCSGSDEALDREYCARIGHLLVQLLAFAVREGRLDPRRGLVPDLRRAIKARGLSMERLFTFAYLTERTALDELALSDAIGAITEPWPVVAQLVRRASFDMLASYAELAQLEPVETTVIDRLTTLHTQVMFEAVMAKEMERAGRYGYPVSIIMFDVDHLSSINKEHGYGVGDRILERLGILIRQYFRQHDWVARHSEDSMVVLLTRTDAGHASELAERVRCTVAERLGFTDHRNDQAVPVTVSASVINVQVALGDIIDPERLMADAETALDRAKRLGRNRVERVDGYTTNRRAPSGTS